MITLESPAARSDAEGCGAVLAELRAQADAMRDAVAVIDEATGEWGVVIDGNTWHRTRSDYIASGMRRAQ